MTAPPLQVGGAQRVPVDQDVPGVGSEQSQGQVRARGFAGAGGSGEHGDGPVGHGEVDSGHAIAAVRIDVVNGPELHEWGVGYGRTSAGVRLIVGDLARVARIVGEAQQIIDGGQGVRQERCALGQ